MPVDLSGSSLFSIFNTISVEKKVLEREEDVRAENGGMVGFAGSTTNTDWNCSFRVLAIMMGSVDTELLW